MAQLEVIALDTAVPQLRAPGGSDTYLMPKDLTIQGTATVDSGATINGGAVFNETGEDVDFRIESDTNANAFFLDGATGSIGIGGTPFGGRKLDIAGTLPESSGFTIPYSLRGTFPSTTANAYGYYSNPTTEATSFTITTLNHFLANPATFGAGSTVSNQYGFHAGNTLTGATNNYGFYSNIASGSGRYNFFANGSADNYFAGNVGIGGTAADNQKLNISGTMPVLSGNANSFGSVVNPTIPSSITNAARGYYSSFSTEAASFTVNEVQHFFAIQGSIGAGSTVTNRYGFYVHSSFNNGTNNYGFYSNIASGSGRYNFYANGSAPNYFAGSIEVNGGAVFNETGADVDFRIESDINDNAFTLDGTTGNIGIGGAPADAAARVTVRGFAPSSGGASRQFYADATIPSTTTTAVTNFQSTGRTEAASFTVTSFSHYLAQQATLGAGSAITSQFGFNAVSTLTGATNNFGFYSNIASGANRWNLFCNGTAENYVANNLKIGGTADRATTAGTAQLVLFDGTAPAGTLANGVSFYSSSGEANVMDAAGNATLLSPHDSETNEWIFRSKHTPTGKVLKIDVEKMLRFINEHFDLDMVQEWTE